MTISLKESNEREVHEAGYNGADVRKGEAEEDELSAG